MHFVNNELDRFDRQEIHFFKVRNQIGEFVQKCKSHFLFCFSPPNGISVRNQVEVKTEEKVTVAQSKSQMHFKQFVINFNISSNIKVKNN